MPDGPRHIELSPDALRKGDRMRKRLHRLSGSENYYRSYDFARAIEDLHSQGYSYLQIGSLLHRTKRRVEQAIQFYGTPKPRDDPKDLLEPAQRHKEMLEWNVDAFARFFVEFSPESYFPKHVRPWIESFLRERNLLLNVPPGHAKSIFFSTWIPIWLICRDRNVQVLLISKTKEFAKAWALDIAGNLEHNEALVQAYGRFKTEDGKWSPTGGTFNVLGRTRTIKGAQFTVESRGMNGQVLGRRADFIIVDDPTDQELAASEVDRRAALLHLREQVFTRAEPQVDKPGGRITVVGQRVHLFDMYGELERQEYEIGPNKGKRLWHNEKYPAIADWDTKKVLWPEKFSWEELQLIYARVGGQGPFSCLYQQEPMPEGTALVTKQWIEACRDYTRGARTGYRASKPEEAVFPIVRVVSVDPSPTQWNGIVVGDLLYDRERFTFALTEVYRMKAGVRELKAEVDRIITTAEPDYLIFEESGFLTWFRDDPWFMELTGRVRFVRHHTGVNKNSKDYGVESLAGDFEFERISLPYGDEDGRQMSDMLANEALTWYPGVKEGYDLLMALWFVKFNYRKLAPVRTLPTRVRGGSGAGWSWMTKLRQKKETDEAAYRRWQKDKARANEQRKVSVG